MPDRNLATDQLRQLLKRLEEVMEEATRLREHVARQLSERKQKVTPIRKPPARKRS